MPICTHGPVVPRRAARVAMFPAIVPLARVLRREKPLTTWDTW